LLEAVQLPLEVTQTMKHMYERYGRQGLPGRLVRQEIPLGARLLAIADTYADLTQNRAIVPQDAAPVRLAKFWRATRHGVRPQTWSTCSAHRDGRRREARLLANRHRALIIDPDPEETTVLELRLLEQGSRCAGAHHRPSAQALEKGETELVIRRARLPPNGDGLGSWPRCASVRGGKSCRGWW